MNDNKNTIVMENVRIVFRNFAGEEGQYNSAGDRNFAVILPEDLAQALTEDGWNVKYLKARDEEEVPTPYLQVSVGYKNWPPKVVMITSRGRTNLSENEVEILDWADIKSCDLIVRPYTWTVNGKSGIKAYLKSLFAIIEEDELELKYADVEEINPIGDPDNA